MTKRARFWAYVNGDYVRLSLRDGQILYWTRHESTDEGHAWEAEKWEREGDVITNDYSNGGRDCDGITSQGGKRSCRTHELAAHWHEYVPADLMVPRWHDGGDWQRDNAAEAAGY